MMFPFTLIFWTYSFRDLQVVSVDPGVATPLTVWQVNTGDAFQVSHSFMLFLMTDNCFYLIFL